MKLEYPIKYAVIPMIEQVRCSNGNREYRPVCYIVSKCYLVCETTNYKNDGTLKTIYQVVCPIKANNRNELVNAVPEYRLISDKCTNSIYVNKIFDSLEEALKVKEQKNDDMLTDIIAHRYIYKEEKQIERDKKEFEDTLSYYNELETAIAKLTQNLVVTTNIKSVFVDVEELDKIVKEAVKNEDNTNGPASVYLDENGELKTTGPKLVKKKKD